MSESRNNEMGDTNSRPGTALNDVRLGDLNGDSQIDAVVMYDPDQSGMFSLVEDATNKWSIASQLDLPPHSHAAALADIDHDGYLDVATVSGSTSTIQVCFGDGSGGFGNCASAPHALE